MLKSIDKKRNQLLIFLVEVNQKSIKHLNYKKLDFEVGAKVVNYFWEKNLVLGRDFAWLFAMF